MKQLSLRKYSLLGLVLMAASAVTAAILPSKASNDENKLVKNGNLQASTGGGNTCIAGGTMATCHDTLSNITNAQSDTSAGAGSAFSSDDTGAGADTNTSGNDTLTGEG